jgi:hypothetical protein
MAGKKTILSLSSLIRKGYSFILSCQFCLPIALTHLTKSQKAIA